jgi:hypothetical protein
MHSKVNADHSIIVFWLAWPPGQLKYELVAELVAGTSDLSMNVT